MSRARCDYCRRSMKPDYTTLEFTLVSPTTVMRGHAGVCSEDCAHHAMAALVQRLFRLTKQQQTNEPQ